MVAAVMALTATKPSAIEPAKFGLNIAHAAGNMLAVRCGLEGSCEGVQQLLTDCVTAVLTKLTEKSG